MLVITIKKESSYGIVAIVAIVAIFNQFSLEVTTHTQGNLETEDLVGEAINSKIKKDSRLKKSPPAFSSSGKTSNNLNHHHFYGFEITPPLTSEGNGYTMSLAGKCGMDDPGCHHSHQIINYIIKPSIGPEYCTSDDENTAAMCGTTDSLSDCQSEVLESLGCYWKQVDVGLRGDWWGYNHDHTLESLEGDRSVTCLPIICPGTTYVSSTTCSGSAAHAGVCPASGTTECYNETAEGETWEFVTHSPGCRYVAGDSVICSELNRQGYMPFEDMKASNDFSSKRLDEHTMLGYHYGAEPLVKVMQKSSHITDLVKPLGLAWGEHMSYKMGVRKEDNNIGKLISEIGIPESQLLGKLLTEKELVNTRISEKEAKRLAEKYLTGLFKGSDEEIKQRINIKLPQLYKEIQSNIK